MYFKNKKSRFLSTEAVRKCHIYFTLSCLKVMIIASFAYSPIALRPERTEFFCLFSTGYLLIDCLLKNSVSRKKYNKNMNLDMNRPEI